MGCGEVLSWLDHAMSPKSVEFSSCEGGKAECRAHAMCFAVICIDERGHLVCRCVTVFVS